MFDSHCHLDFPALMADRQELLAEARRAGISGWLVPGFDLTARAAASELCDRGDVHFAAGIHPYVVSSVTNLSSAIQQLEAIARERGVVAIGECGIDSRKKGLDFEGQPALFEAQLDLATQLELPVVIHQVGAQREFLKSLARVKNPRRGGVVHAFSGDLAWAKCLLRQGFHLGVGPRVLHPRADRLRTAVFEIPEERLLIETDAPDQKPPRASRGVPLDLCEVLRAVAEVRKCDPGALGAATERNARRLFALENTSRPRERLD